jgi:hypothetical protein
MAWGTEILEPTVNYFKRSLDLSLWVGIGCGIQSKEKTVQII